MRPVTAAVPSGLRVGIAAVALLVAVSGCAAGSPLSLGNDADEVITVGSQGTPENEILAQIYGQVLEQAGYTVEYRQSIGPRRDFLAALADRSLDLVIDYSGELLAQVDPEATATSTARIDAALPSRLDPLGVTVLHSAAAEATDVFVVLDEFAEKYSLVSIADLAPIDSITRLGAGSGFEPVWAVPLERTYGLDELVFSPIDDAGGALTVQQLLDGLIEVARLRATDPAIAENELVVLTDPESVFPAQNAVPLLGLDLDERELSGLFAAVSTQLTTADLAELNARYAGADQPSAAELATEWLRSRGLLF